MDFKNSLYARLERYCKADTQSDPDSKTFPSTKKQLVLLKTLAAELRKIGAKRVRMDRWGYVTAELPATVKGKKPAIGFLAHADTSPDASGAGVKPQVHRAWKGGDIVISRRHGVTLNKKNCPELAGREGEDIVTASGDTLLGADNKAGIAIMMTVPNTCSKTPEYRTAP